MRLPNIASLSLKTTFAAAITFILAACSEAALEGKYKSTQNDTTIEFIKGGAGLLGNIGETNSIVFSWERLGEDRLKMTFNDPSISKGMAPQICSYKF
ncbi:MAG: hypothetical protein J0I23_32010, partial [Rhizobiales bacterium]|nr:hypothetical protein [Hyphomicrobiales bacterium]